MYVFADSESAQHRVLCGLGGAAALLRWPVTSTSSSSTATDTTSSEDEDISMPHSVEPHATDLIMHGNETSDSTVIIGRSPSTPSLSWQADAHLPPFPSAAAVAARLRTVSGDTPRLCDGVEEEVEAMEAIYPSSEGDASSHSGCRIEFSRVGAEGSVCVLTVVDPHGRGVCLALMLSHEYPIVQPSVAVVDARDMSQAEERLLVDMVADVCAAEAGEPVRFVHASIYPPCLKITATLANIYFISSLEMMGSYFG